MAEDTTPQDADDVGPDDMESVANRLEAALDRIARQLDLPQTEAPEPPAPVRDELAARLDGAIARLRDALGLDVQN